MELNEKEKIIAFVKDAYPEGTKIVLKEMPDDPQPIKAGTMGTIKDVVRGPYGEPILYVSWENGSSRNLIYGVDKFEAVKEGA